jgi:Ion channel
MWPMRSDIGIPIICDGEADTEFADSAGGADGDVKEWPLTALVILAVIELFVIAPLAQKTGVPSIIQIMVAAAIFASILAVVWGNRIAVTAVVLGTATEVAATILRGVRPSEGTELLDFSAAIILVVGLTVVLAVAVFGPGQVTIHRILGAIAIYFSVAASFALAYRLLVALGPDAFRPRSAGAPEHTFTALVYFSFATLTTSGYGDIVAVDPVARSLTNLESVFGQLYPATLLARLITLELEARRERDK